MMKPDQTEEPEIPAQNAALPPAPRKLSFEDLKAMTVEDLLEIASRAGDTLMPQGRREDANDLVLVCARLNRLKADMEKRVMTSEDVSVEKNRIALSLEYYLKAFDLSGMSE